MTALYKTGLEPFLSFLCGLSVRSTYLLRSQMIRETMTAAIELTQLQQRPHLTCSAYTTTAVMLNDPLVIHSTEIETRRCTEIIEDSRYTAIYPFRNVYDCQIPTKIQLHLANIQETLNRYLNFKHFIFYYPIEQAKHLATDNIASNRISISQICVLYLISNAVKYP